MVAPTVPDDLRRFIFTSIASVPHLEALLLARSAPAQEWDTAAVARRLYIADRLARKVLDYLRAIGALSAAGAAASPVYRYAPRTAELQQFADAFTWKKEV
ncbi:hypothetical protein SAMN05192549_10489 [Duganella sacchari]|uniref:Uncharacterized protein n=1 Tax=Duganella sacchari TaxID=551987 RepID=A0A1M7NNX6_9BURK|nr:hypothetical protein [Duganella sacchari]SHN05706.1 hypothetical protein SAMN05192549_10489 [Duganella sacchari]